MRSPSGLPWRADNKSMASTPDTVTKLMAANPAEFARGMERLTRDMTSRADGSATVIDLPGGSVAITYTPKQGRRLSPLLVMPAADVVFTFTDVTDEDRAAFIAKFDLVFQRGGG